MRTGILNWTQTNNNTHAFEMEWNVLMIPKQHNTFVPSTERDCVCEVCGKVKKKLVNNHEN